ncbi:MAG: metallophosphoesterase [Nannocystaceae bacterium]|nr:metallophosphoesterase [Nannocystaceae bacterium]
MMPDFALFHISDLHFGAELYPRWNRQGAPVAPTGVPLAAKLPKTQGLFPHSIAACEELENAITDEYDQLGAARNIVAATGDLTVCGADSEFSLALTYLQSRIAQTHNLRLGLADPKRPLRVLSIPGNHDHWGGHVRHMLGRANGPNRSIHG